MNSVETHEQSTVKVSFGNGRYSAVMEELYKDIQRIFNISAEQAEKVARQFGSDFGAAMASQPVSVKYGKKLSDDGKLTLAESCRAKGITATNSIMVARACDWVNTCKNFGVSYTDTQWKLSGLLDKWVNEL
jgi:hypothetical protein